MRNEENEKTDLFVQKNKQLKESTANTDFAMNIIIIK